MSGFTFEEASLYVFTKRRGLLDRLADASEVNLPCPEDCGEGPTRNEMVANLLAKLNSKEISPS